MSKEAILNEEPPEEGEFIDGFRVRDKIPQDGGAVLKILEAERPRPSEPLGHGSPEAKKIIKKVKKELKDKGGYRNDPIPK